MPLPTTNTARLLIQYTSCGDPHVLQLRFATPTSLAEALSKSEAVLDAMQPLMAPIDGVTGALWYAQGSNVSVPAPVATFSGTNAGTISDDVDKARFIALAGRSPGGVPVRVTLFTPFIGEGYGFRVGAVAIGAPWTDLWTAILDADNSIVAKDGTLPYWKSYFNIGINAYFQRKNR